MGFGQGPFGQTAFGLGEPETAFPVYQSGLFLLEPRIYQATRDNVLGKDITGQVISAKIDNDIDRSGPKSRLKINAATADAIPARGWVAPFLDITPETGEVVSSQMGLFELDEPTVTYDMYGGKPAEGGGKDIIGLIQRSHLTEHQFINPDIDVMGEVKRCIQMATLDYAGPNVYAHTLTRPITDWGVVSTSGAWVGGSQLGTYPGFGPRGDHAFVSWADPGTTAGSVRYLNGVAHKQAIPAGASRIWTSYYYHANSWLWDSRMEVAFYNAAGVHMSSVGGVYNTHEAIDTWLPVTQVFDIPVGAATFAITLYGRVKSAPGTTINLRLAAPEVGMAFGTPLTRFALPRLQLNVSKTMAHRPGVSWLTRINDILGSVNYHALTATLDARPTTVPIRNVRTTAASRVYKVGQDIRVAGNITATRTSDDVKNIVIAVKEDPQTGTMIYAIARNDDPAHPWSTRRIGPASVEILSNDAANEAALQALADAYLSRVSAQQALQFDVLPDPYLTAHDIIEVAGAIDDINGRWLIDSIDWGLTADSPLVRIQARRVTTSSEVSS